ncbi:hypothetical protein AB0C76_34570 [Kitasatospora sp. NPDC048722]|uniref:hypothetical protein n=1 Tax=Kitasatospora sp. NPDC048722 TaxID=3155639 RepID=UPI0033E7C8A5
MTPLPTVADGMSAPETITALRTLLDEHAATIAHHPATVGRIRVLVAEISAFPSRHGSGRGTGLETGAGTGTGTGSSHRRAPGGPSQIDAVLDRLMARTGPLSRDTEVTERIRRLHRAVTDAANAAPGTDTLSQRERASALALLDLLIARAPEIGADPGATERVHTLNEAVSPEN